MSNRSIGLVGLGKMGGNIALRLLSRGYKLSVYTSKRDKIKRFGKLGTFATDSMQAFLKNLARPRIVWLMLPAGQVTEDCIAKLSAMLSKGDIVIDGSNSRYTNAIKDYDLLKKKGIYYLDAGCSGGPSGALNGMCIMTGGDKAVYKRLETLFEDLSVKDGCLYVGPAGSGHFVKMVHNAIEYGMMQSLAEGLELVWQGPYENLDLAAIAHLWDNGSVIRGYMIELAERALSKDPKLKSIAPYVEDTGEGRWAIEAAIDHDVPFTVISHALFERMRSRSDYRFSNRVLAALRHEFGGHAVKKSR